MMDKVSICRRIENGAAMSDYAHLTADERDRREALKAGGLSLLAFGRAASTISRELARNALDSGAQWGHPHHQWRTPIAREGLWEADHPGNEVLFVVSTVCACSIIRLHVDPGAVVGDGGGRRAGVEEEAWRQELRGSGQVGGDLLLEGCAGDLVDHSHPDG